jgi:hypothetical protein
MAAISSDGLSGSPAAREGDTKAHPTATLGLDLFRATPAGECLVSSKHCTALCGTKLNSLTPLGSVVLPLLKSTR